jgi:hypothetical protein
VANLTPKKKWDQVPQLIGSKRGNVSAIARALRMPRSSVHVKIQEDDALRQLLADEREKMLDDAEDKLGGAVRKGEAWAVCFTLKTQGKERGYTERQELTGKDGTALVPQRFIVEVVSSDSASSDNESQNE